MNRISTKLDRKLFTIFRWFILFLPFLLVVISAFFTYNNSGTTLAFYDYVLAYDDFSSSASFMLDFDQLGIVRFFLDLFYDVFGIPDDRYMINFLSLYIGYFLVAETIFVFFRFFHWFFNFICFLFDKADVKL